MAWYFVCKFEKENVKYSGKIRKKAKNMDKTLKKAAGAG